MTKRITSNTIPPTALHTMMIISRVLHREGEGGSVRGRGGGGGGEGKGRGRGSIREVEGRKSKIREEMNGPGR